ncbi:MAG: S41 family peptidase [Bacteroidaceae bacterium]|nr:S41 family peptidase [Bacteroidaceae bacterium]
MKFKFIIFFLLFTTAVMGQTNHNFEVSKNLEIFNSIYKTLDLYYVDSLQAEKQIDEAINYLLDGLDPYTEYFPEKETRDLETMTTGKYAGIGARISYNKAKDRCIINDPYENMPAVNAGIRAGDIIMSIDGKDVNVKGSQTIEDYTSSVSNRLRGDPNTQITLIIQRPGEKDLKTFKFTRAAIQLPAVPYYGMVTDSIGFIFLSTFTKDCAQNVQQALHELKQKGARSLILDIRNNGGGLAIEAVNIVNLFVPKGKLILQMKGKTKSANSSYFTRREPEDLQIPLVVLVNGQSASASEITCGALQDLDRAVILGQRTFGKGLVQQPHELPYGGLLKLTTSHYYIPSGRCIQALDYSHRSQDGEVYRTPDSLTHVFHTVAGRKVRDGGGITPDVISKADSLPHLLAYLRISDQFFDFVTQYRIHHTSIAPAAEFSITDQDYQAFKDSLVKSDFTYDRQTYKALQELKKIAHFEGYDKTAAPEIAALEKKLQHNLSGDLDTWEKEIKQLLNKEICNRYYYQKGMIENGFKTDSVLHDAISLLRHPAEYNKLLKKK